MQEHNRLSEEMYKKRENPIAKDNKFVAGKYIHNVLTARNDPKLQKGLNVIPLRERMKGVSYINTFRSLMNYPINCSVSQMFVGKLNYNLKEKVRLNCAIFICRIVKRKVVINSSTIITSVILQNILN